MSTRNIPQHVIDELDRQLLIRLRESEFDLQTELASLADEIETRQRQVSCVMKRLAHVRRQRSELLDQFLPCGRPALRSNSQSSRKPLRPKTATAAAWGFAVGRLLSPDQDR
jgi:hypothetical protein